MNLRSQAQIDKVNTERSSIDTIFFGNVHPQSHREHTIGGRVHDVASHGPESFLTSFIGNLGAPLDVHDEESEDRDQDDDDSEETKQFSDRLGPQKEMRYNSEI